jgi:hypothetical protein
MEENLDILDCKHVMKECEEERVGEEMQPLPLCPAHKEAFTVLVMLHFLPSSVGADDRVMRAVVVVQEFVPNTYKASVKQRSVDSYFQK